MTDPSTNTDRPAAHLTDELRLRLSCFTYSQLHCYIDALQTAGKNLHPLWGIGQNNELPSFDRTASLPFALGKRIIDAAAALDTTGRLAIQLGQQTDLLPQSLLSVAVRTSPSLQTALGTFAEFSLRRVCVFRFKLTPAQGGMRFQLTTRLPLGTATTFLTLQMLTALHSMLRQLVEEPLDGLRLELSDHQTPRHAALQALYPHIQPHAAHTSLWLPSRLLNTPCREANPDEHAQALKSCADQHRQADTPMGVSALVLRLIDATDLRELSEHWLTEQFGLSRRTLVRLLESEGTCFRTLVTEVRKQRALKLLQQNSLTVSDLAHKLGYASTSNFSRAFHRWYGMPPIQMRTQMNQTGRPAGTFR